MKQKIISVLLCLVLILIPLSATAMHQCVGKDADIWCDICGDGKINMADAAKLYAHIKGTNKLF